MSLVISLCVEPALQTISPLPHESAILENVKTQLLGEDVPDYVTKQFKAAIREIENQPNDSELLTGKLRTIDSKLAKLAEAIEAVGVSETLANRLTILEQEKAETEQALDSTRSPVKFLPNVLPALFNRWRELVTRIEALAENPHTTLEDIEAARSHLHALLGAVTLKPRDGVLWAHTSPNAKGLVETRPLDGLHINRPKMVAGARLSNFMQIEIEPFPLVA